MWTVLDTVDFQCCYKFISLKLSFQLIWECKEVLQAAKTVKLYYQQMVTAVMSKQERENFNFDLEQYEEDMEKMLDVSIVQVGKCYLLLVTYVLFHVK